jgi:hypothetical protein
LLHQGLLGAQALVNHFREAVLRVKGCRVEPTDEDITDGSGSRLKGLGGAQR